MQCGRGAEAARCTGAPPPRTTPSSASERSSRWASASPRIPISALWVLLPRAVEVNGSGRVSRAVPVTLTLIPPSDRLRRLLLLPNHRQHPIKSPIQRYHHHHHYHLRCRYIPFLFQPRKSCPPNLQHRRRCPVTACVPPKPSFRSCLPSPPMPRHRCPPCALAPSHIDFL